jgi:AraC-like DNA-binding protein
MTKPEKICEEIIKIILKSDLNILKDLTCSKLALMYGIDRSYLSRIFKECQGIYLREALKRLKLLRCAFFMVENRDLTVKETYNLFGFENLNYFIISFREFFGMTPGKFIKCTL